MGLLRKGKGKKSGNGNAGLDLNVKVVRVYLISRLVLRSRVDWG